MIEGVIMNKPFIVLALAVHEVIVRVSKASCDYDFSIYGK